MEPNETGRRLRQRAQQKTAQLLARRTTEAMLPPNLAQRMHTRAAPRVDRRQPAGQTAIVARGLLDCRHLLRRQRLVEVSL